MASLAFLKCLSAIFYWADMGIGFQVWNCVKNILIMMIGGNVIFAKYADR